MRVSQRHKFPPELENAGTSNMFRYATARRRTDPGLNNDTLKIWDRLHQKDLDGLSTRIRSNGFEELIRLTEEGKLWRYPIDNEQGLEAEQQVPFEEHVFLDHHLEDFPKNESIRSFMELVISGLAKNPHMTVDRKKKVIDYYRGYFDSKRQLYKEAGFNIDE